MDGNFTAQHMKMKSPQDDVSLADGLAYMVEDKPYQNHVSSTPDNKEVCSLSVCESGGGVILVCPSSPRDQLVKITVQSMMQIPINPIFEPLGWEPRPVLAMGALFLIQSWIFIRGNSESPGFPCFSPLV